LRPYSAVLNLKKWLEVMDSYVNGGFSYYATMPTVRWWCSLTPG